MNNEIIKITDFLVNKPENIWILAIVGAVCVIGVVDYLKCFFEGKKKAIRWVVLFMSLIVAFLLSQTVPAIISFLVITWLLILALATIFKKHIIDGIGALIDKIANSISGKKKELD